MPNDLWSSDENAEKIYKHSGGSSVIAISFTPPVADVWGLAWGDGGLWSCGMDSSYGYIYHHSGGTATITASYQTSAYYPRGLAWDGTNLWSCRGQAVTSIYKHSGGTATVTLSIYYSTNYINGMTWNGDNIWLISVSSDQSYIHKINEDGDVLSTFYPAVANLRATGLAFDGTNLWVGNYGTNKIYKQSGETSTVTLSFSSPSGTIRGLTWQPVDPPAVTTQTPSDVEETTATLNGTITSLGGDTDCSRRGFCYVAGTSGDPTVADSVAYDDGSFAVGAYTKAIVGLTGFTSYRVRAYAINGGGTGYGVTVQTKTGPAAPTDVAATSGGHTDKVVITWTKASGATGYQVYRDGDALGWLGDVATYDDEGADAPVITPGTATATDGSYTDKVTLGVGSESVANGTTHTYKVKSRNATGESEDSATDTGYVGHGTLAYQWQRSALDADEDFENITGATTEDYDDTEAPT